MNAIDLTGIEFTWPGNDYPTLAIDSLKLEKGGQLFVAGSSGSGKSTLLALVGGIITPQKGKVSVLGNEMGKMRDTWRDRFRVDHIGFIFQQFNLIPYLSVIDNVLLPCRFSKMRHQGSFSQGASPHEAAGILLNELGLGKNIWAKQAHTLSVGQQQRVAAARALIGKPALIMADEPTSALDAGHQADFLRLLKGECARTSTALIFVSHDERLADSFSSRYILMPVSKGDAA